MATGPANYHAEAVAARAEFRWMLVVAGVIGLLMVMIAFTTLHWAFMPTKRIETVNPSTLHLEGEFVEANLGSAVEPDGSVTVRVVGPQYSFTPQCILVPTDALITFRATSADVVHGFLIGGTNVNTMLVPGYVSTVTARFVEPGEHVMPCHEFCGMGHQGMWAKVKVVDKDEFTRLSQGKRRLTCVE